MVEVPTLEQQREQQQFRYQRIKLVLFSQTRFDNVMRREETRGADKTKHEDPNPFDYTLLKGFEGFTQAEQITAYRTIPKRLRDMIFEEQIPDELSTRSHHWHRLKRRPGVHDLTSVDGVMTRWWCDSIEGSEGCFKATKEQWKNEPQLIRGWRCEDDECVEKGGFDLCEECLTCEWHIMQLILILDNEAQRKNLHTKLELYNLQENDEIDAYKQAYANVPLAIDDCEFAKKIFLTQYLVMPKDIIELKNKTTSECEQEYIDLSKEVQDNPDTNYLIVHVLAGHGVQKDGSQTLLTNEFDEESKFYKRFIVEKLIREFAKVATNSYHVGIFACCREAEKQDYNYTSRDAVNAYHQEQAEEKLDRQLTLGPGDPPESGETSSSESESDGDEQLNSRADLDKEVLGPNRTTGKMGNITNLEIEHSSQRQEAMSRRSSRQSGKGMNYAALLTGQKGFVKVKDEMTEENLLRLMKHSMLDSMQSSRYQDRRKAKENDSSSQPNFNPIMRKITMLNAGASGEKFYNANSRRASPMLSIASASEWSSDANEVGQVTKLTRGGGEVKIEKKKKTLALQAENYCLVFGTAPANQVTMDTKMVKNLLDHLSLRMHKKLQFVEFPSILNQMDADDAHFELSVSNSVQRCRLYNKKSIYTKLTFEHIKETIGVIVVNSRSGEELEYEPDVEVNETETAIEKQVAETMELFENLKVAKDSIKVLEDKSKEEITSYFESLVQVSEDFEELQKNYEEKQLLAIFVRWIGFDATPTPIIDKNNKIIKKASKDLAKMGTMQVYQKGHNVKSIKLDHYGLTCSGEPVCIEAYCAQLASQSLTHVMLIQDLSFEEIDEEHVDMQTTFNEPHFNDEQAFDRFCRFLAYPEVISKQFQSFSKSTRKRQLKRQGQVYLFPDSFSESTFNDSKFSIKGEWMLKDSFTEQIVLDLRTPLQKSLQAQQQSELTFRPNFDIWEDKPRIMSSVELEPKNNSASSTVHHLEHQEMILHIESTVQPSKVKFVFFRATEPFQRLTEAGSQKEDDLTITCHAKPRTQLVRDLRSTRQVENDRLIAIIDDQEYGDQHHIEKIKNHDGKEDHIKIVQLTSKDGQAYEKPEVMMNIPNYHLTIAAFLMEHDNLLVVTKEMTIVIDAKRWTILNKANHAELIHPAFKGKFSYSCQPDYHLNFKGTGAGFLRTFESTVPEEIQSNHAMIQHKEVDKDSFSWIARFSFEYKEQLRLSQDKHYVGKMVLKSPKEESVLFKGELCWSAFEYAPGRMLVSTKNHIFNLKNWKLTQVYENPTYKANFDKMGYFTAVHGYDIDKFPFVIVTGRQNINIINVNSGYIHPLVFCKSTATYGQEAFFFLKTDLGIILNFVTGREIFNGNKRLNWVAMDLKPQFSKTLEVIGMLPRSSSKGLIETQLENNRWREKKRIRDMLGEDPMAVELREVKRLLKKEKKQFNQQVIDNEEKRKYDVKEQGNKCQRQLDLNEKQILWQKYEVAEAKSELEEIKKVIPHLQEEIAKLQKSKERYKKTIMQQDRFKPCLALADQQKKIARRAIAAIGARNRENIMRTLHNHSPSRGTNNESFRTLIKDSSVQRLHDESKYIATLPAIEPAEETMEQRMQILKSIKNQGLFAITGSVTRIQERSAQGLPPDTQEKSLTQDARNTADSMGGSAQYGRTPPPIDQHKKNIMDFSYSSSRQGHARFQSLN